MAISGKSQLELGLTRVPSAIHKRGSMGIGVHYLASSLVLACPLGLLPWLLPARTSRSLSPMSPPRCALVVLPRPVLVLL